MSVTPANDVQPLTGAQADRDHYVTAKTAHFINE